MFELGGLLKVNTNSKYYQCPHYSLSIFSINLFIFSWRELHKCQGFMVYVFFICFIPVRTEHRYQHESLINNTRTGISCHIYSRLFPSMQLVY